jgi:hypothetical protein
MRKFLGLVLFAVLLAGCAASSYKTARGHANEVTNGMTLAQVTSLLGMPPSHLTEDRAEWRRGNAQAYDATPKGSILFKLKDGVVVDVPDGGIFGPIAYQQFDDARNAEWELERARTAKNTADEAARLMAEIHAEGEAKATSFVICNDKSTCSKSFALAQIYVSQNADQKIQVATDTIIETYNPTEGGNVGIGITKMPRSGSMEIISISPSCKDDAKAFASICRLKRTRIYAGFRPFIEASLAK